MPSKAEALIPPLSRDERALRWGLVAAIAAALTLAACLAPPADNRLYIGRWPLPGLCVFRELFGTDCPGCGLTRAWVFLAHGKVAASWQSHSLGPPLFAFALLQALRHALSLTLPRIRPALEVPAKLLDRFGLFLAVLAVPAWIARLS